jgi:hypothetical protein
MLDLREGLVDDAFHLLSELLVASGFASGVAGAGRVVVVIVVIIVIFVGGFIRAVLLCLFGEFLSFQHCSTEVTSLSFNMSETGGRGNDRGGRGTNSRDTRGRGRGQNYTGTGNKPTKSGLLCATLGSHVFDYGHSAAADQMRTSWEKLVQHVGTAYGEDISNELTNRTTVTIADRIYRGIPDSRFLESVPL